MSAVVPKDHTGLTPHPTKLDCWVRSNCTPGDNLCMETPIGEILECTLGRPDLSKLSHVHLTQIQMELWNNRGGGPVGKIMNAFYSGATPDQLMSYKEVDDYADDLIHYLGDARKASDYIDKLKGDVRRHIIENYINPVNHHQGSNPRMFDSDVTKAADSSSEIINKKLIADPECPYMELPKKKAVEVFNEISINWKIQIYNNIQRRYGGTKANTVDDTAVDLLPEEMVEEFANELLNEMGVIPKEAAVLLKNYMEEHITMMSAFAMHQAMKGDGKMQELTNLVDAEVDKFSNDKGYAQEVSDLISNTPSVDSSTPKPEQFVNPKRANRKKKKKRAKRRHHLNMGDKSVKRILGASLLHRLGTVQQQHTDATKKVLLKELPAADLIEVATGKKLPDYQANLINGFQAKADPEAPVVKRHKEEVLEDLQQETAKVLELTDELEDRLPLVRIEWDDRGEQFFVKRSTMEEFAFEVVDIFNSVAEELGSPVAFIDQIARGKDYLKGLNRAIVDNLHGKVYGELEEIQGAVKAVYERIIVSYTSGFVKGVAHSTSKAASDIAVATNPAELG